MRRLLLFSFLHFSTSALAATQTCYSTKSPLAPVAARVCLTDVAYDAYDVDFKKAIIRVRGGVLEGEYPILKTEYLSDQTVEFTSSRTVHSSSEDGCGEAEWVSIVIRTVYDFMTPLTADQLKISVEKTTTPDRCHTATQTKSVDYKIDTN